MKAGSREDSKWNNVHKEFQFGKELRRTEVLTMPWECTWRITGCCLLTRG
jgi:hypothetical protein